MLVVGTEVVWKEASLTPDPKAALPPHLVDHFSFIETGVEDLECGATLFRPTATGFSPP